MESDGSVQIFHTFRDKVFDKSGFYILKGYGNVDIRTYCDKPLHRYGNVYTFWATSKNDKYKHEHDLGICYWVNSHHINYQPHSWRNMEFIEIKEFWNELYQFGRPSYFHPNGKKQLSKLSVDKNGSIVYNGIW